MLVAVVAALGFSKIPADVGFDPLGLQTLDLHLFATTGRPKHAVLRDYREAELKHGRLAMLATAAWPAQELLEPKLAALCGLPDLLAATNGRSLSLVNGGLEQSRVPTVIVAFVVLAALAEMHADDLRVDDYEPGDLRWRTAPIDPLFQSSEVWHGRAAMLAIVGVVTYEAVAGSPFFH